MHISLTSNAHHSKIRKGRDSVRKDLNLLGYNDSLEEALPELAQRFMLGDPERRKKFLDQVKADAYFLAKMGIMDYSLLVGVHGRTPKLVPGYNIGRGDGKANGFVEVVEDAVERDRELKDAQRFVYNTKKMAEVLMQDEGMSYEEAWEYLEFNTFSAYVGENTPIYVEEIDDEY